MTAPVELMGAPGSPYTRKMLALMRFRHIPYRIRWQGTQPEKLQPKVPLLPTYYLPDESGEMAAVTDSTPILRRFEKEYEGRNVIPPDAAYGFLNWLIEDYADEWLTKAMFHFRWHYADDIAKAGSILPRWRDVTLDDETMKGLSETVRERQIGRLAYVGSNATTKPVIEARFKQFLTLFDAHLTHTPFLFGARPASADFAIYGQLTCLALFDPTPQKLIVEHHPRVYAWVEMMEDLSGLAAEDGGWIAGDPPPTLLEILREIGAIYLPYLRANAAAVMAGAEAVEAEIGGGAWTQNPFPYQAKCLQWTMEAYKNLEAETRARLDAWLADTHITEQLNG